MDRDEQVADLHYADTPEFATGHGVSADWDIVDGACRRLRTTWIPNASVEKTETVDVADVELSMEALGALADGAAATTALQPLVDEYRRWIDERRDATGALQGERRTTGEGLLHRAGHAADRIEQGIALLASDEDALDAFRVANRAVASALCQRLGDQFDAQPKTHAEYIQATSRVGRDNRRPGLVVTLLNAHKPRDRSHYERFRHYHETFYRSVEVASVTPFSARALDRGFSGALVGL